MRKLLLVLVLACLIPQLVLAGGFAYVGEVEKLEIRARQVGTEMRAYFVLFFDDGFVYAMRECEWRKVGPVWPGDRVKIQFPSAPEVTKLDGSTRRSAE